MADANARLEFLWRASHMMLSQCPSASSHYMSQFLNLANTRELRLHEDIQARSCAACGSIFVPGVNAKVRVVPVKETKLEREKRKKKAKKVKNDKSKDGTAWEDETRPIGLGIANPIQDTVPALSPNSIGPTIARPNTSPSSSTSLSTPKRQPQPSQQPAKKIIRITPYAELAQQQQQHQQHRRQLGGNADGKSLKKIDKRAKQILNHIIYSCRRCNRDTELSGTKEGYLTSRVKAIKPVSQKRKLRMEQQTATNIVAASSPVLTGTVPSPSFKSGSEKKNLVSTLTNESTKRPALPQLTSSALNVKRPKYVSSTPASPVGGLSMASSTKTSTTTFPSSSPRPSRPDISLPGSGNKKKKKGGLASLLASQKAKDSSSGPDSGASGSGGDSVLANFLMGL
ncbi:hypothetical protein BC939DRAFT_437460 [Gamsiella multidivaricata]|uniref:uncharacterized protein n=1 Tax=Gamsiella multidivaricata TaxID=101098 RepID=UPI0022201EC0|nr:uncharacterized protein BC939DRAFT_437460 [Gamsiella multidivaricata]KAG0371014.1 hypothetical protein BGZ54_001368 [Gamsiella multidivaricata]KAI7831575.1 hypothetical protein BC939DRAFT_437460 [Gamsiella multidivaricata]